MLRSLTGGGSGGNGQAMPGGRPLPAIIRRAVCYSGLPRLMRHVQRDDCTVVAYHGVIPDELWRGWIMADMIPLSLFRRQLQFYRRHYNVIGLRELVSGLSSPGGKLPPRSMAITFDDGYRNNLQVALPALTAAKMPATIFVTSGFIDGKTEFWWLRLKKVFAAAMGRRAKVQLLPGLALATDNAQHAYLNYRLALRTLKAMPASERLEILDRLSADFPMTYDADVAALFEPLSWAEVEQIHAQGFEVGAHTVTHPILSQETGEAAAWEIRESVGCIRQRLNVDEVAFSYPNGQWLDFTVTLEAVIRDAGCYCAVASVPGANRRGDDPYALRRLPIGGQHSMAAVELEACGVNELLQTVRRIPSRLVRRGAGGRKNINHSATVKADGRTGSAAAPIVTAAAAIGADGSNIIWGEEVDGLRLGVAMEPLWPGEPPRETLGAVLHVQNIGARALTLCDRIINRQPLPRLVDFSLGLLDLGGQAVELTDVLPQGLPIDRQFRLLSGDSRPLGMVLLTPHQQKPGDVQAPLDAACMQTQPCLQAQQNMRATSNADAGTASAAGLLSAASRVVASYRFCDGGHADWSGTLTAGEAVTRPPASAK